MWIRYANRNDKIFYGARHTRSAIYIGLIGCWGVSVRMRIVQTQVRDMLTAIAVLMLLWLLMRSVKYSLEYSYICRYLWYRHYLSMLFIPLLSLFVALSLGKPENCRLPRWTVCLIAVTVLLFLLVVTNDLRDPVFSFPGGIRSDMEEYVYEPGYYTVTVWSALCALTAMVIILIKCRVPYSRKYRFRPLVPFALSIAYAAAYARGVHWVWVLAGDLTVTQYIIFTSILESCIQCGLIQSNAGYRELFEATPAKLKREQVKTARAPAG